MSDNKKYANEGSHMYYKDYRQDADIEGAIEHNHRTEAALVSKIAAKLRGRAGRFRGKSGTHENNKARGGKMAR